MDAQDSASVVAFKHALQVGLRDKAGCKASWEKKTNATFQAQVDIFFLSFFFSSFFFFSFFLRVVCLQRGQLLVNNLTNVRTAMLILISSTIFLA